MTCPSAIDLGADCPLTEAARAKREAVDEALSNALYCNRHDPIGGNVVHCVLHALRLMGHPEVAARSTEADMVLDALDSPVVQGVIALAAGLPNDHAAAAIQEVVEAVA